MLGPGQADQILVNLAVDARDALGGVGRVEIETRLASVSSSQDSLAVGWYVRVSVRALTDDPETSADTSKTARPAAWGLEVVDEIARGRGRRGSNRTGERGRRGPARLRATAGLPLERRSAQPRRRAAKKLLSCSEASAAKRPDSTVGRWLSRGSASTSRTDPAAPAFGSVAA